ncbi:four-helix bundle copper-binding protein [Streptomyces sp. NBC_01077]|uniref:four-helix bundle copper-binding protein n=1 Tax=Streptomyces sp. NBC_01077 TaxID=2903746 RepID=UPI0038658F34|nr:four-helix bundle copper-binding protein [Streptomyces sp. NBC_01077]WSV43564.1 four-helix bundle copper-binding protein [Streptomyces sp. NBC_01077]
MAQQQSAVSPLSVEMQNAIEACMSCHTVCEESLSACMSTDGHAQTQIMRALMDCSELTRMCADMMMRRSPMTAEMCTLCSKACEMCAEACMSMPDDALLMRCAEACRSCAEMCRSMADAM